jgi:nucleoid-associated protein EbfC
MSDFDINSLLSQAMAMQSQLAEAQQQAAATEVVGSAGNGSVHITMRGDGEVTRVSIDPKIVDPADIEMLEDLLLAAFRDAGGQVAQLQSETMSQVTGGMGDMGLGDMGGFGGLLGPGA